MGFRTSRGVALGAAGLLAGSLALSACGSDDDGGDGLDSGATEITFLTNNDPANVTTAEAVIEAFEAANWTSRSSWKPARVAPTATTWSRPGCRPATWPRCSSTTGSLFQAIAPTTNLTPVTDEAWVADLDETFKEVVSAEGDVLAPPGDPPPAAESSTTSPPTSSSAWRSPRPGTSS